MHYTAVSGVNAAIMIPVSSATVIWLPRCPQQLSYPSTGSNSQSNLSGSPLQDVGGSKSDSESKSDSSKSKSSGSKISCITGMDGLLGSPAISQSSKLGEALHLQSVLCCTMQ